MLESPQAFPPITRGENSAVIKLRVQEAIEILPREEFKIDFRTKLKFPDNAYGLMITSINDKLHLLYAQPQFIGKSLFYCNNIKHYVQWEQFFFREWKANYGKSVQHKQCADGKHLGGGRIGGNPSGASRSNKIGWIHQAARSLHGPGIAKDAT
jgi:hypothetical protein